MQYPGTHPLMASRHLDAAPRHEAHANVAVARVAQLRRRGVERLRCGGARWVSKYKYGGLVVLNIYIHRVNRYLNANGKG